MPKRLLVAIVTLLCHAAGLAAAQEPVVELRLSSGRRFSGAIDAASTEAQLVIRTAADGLTIRRPVRWERIAGATIAERPVDVAELKRLAAEARSQGPVARDQGPVVRPPPSLIEIAEAAAPPPVVVAPLPVATISFDAFIANWDGDVETDGLIVELVPIDSFGNLTRTAGVVEVELFASQRRIMLQHAPLSGGDTFERVERWSRAVEPEEIGPSGVRLRLPFGAIHPELNSDWLAYNYGLVHVRFVAPGSGVFDDSRDGIRVRPWAPNRDYLEMNTGRRFLPTEHLGRRN